MHGKRDSPPKKDDLLNSVQQIVKKESLNTAFHDGRPRETWFKNKKMGKIVWLLKSEDGSCSDSYTTELTKKGFHVKSVPTLSFKFINENVLLDAIKNPNNHSGIIFTSIRAVEAVAKVYEKINISQHSIWCSKSIFAIGPATLQAVKSKLQLSALGDDAGNAQQLAAIVLRNTKPFDKPLLFPCGNLKRDELPSLLASNDRDFRAITCYETFQHLQLQPTLEKLTCELKPDYIVLFSPSGVHFAIPLMKKLNFNFTGIKVLAIGPTTNAALVKENIPVSGICLTPSPEGLLQLLIL